MGPGCISGGISIARTLLSRIVGSGHTIAGSGDLPCSSNTPWVQLYQSLARYYLAIPCGFPGKIAAAIEANSSRLTYN